MSNKSRLLTIEEFEVLPFERPTELVRGKLVELGPLYATHGSVCCAMGYELGRWDKSVNVGITCVNNTGFVTERDPDTVRCPDVSWVRRDRLTNGKAPRGVLRCPFDLAVEVLSESDHKRDLLMKVDEYL